MGVERGLGAGVGGEEVLATWMGWARGRHYEVKEGALEYMSRSGIGLSCRFSRRMLSSSNTLKRTDHLASSVRAYGRSRSICRLQHLHLALLASGHDHSVNGPTRAKRRMHAGIASIASHSPHPSIELTDITQRAEVGQDFDSISVKCILQRHETLSFQTMHTQHQFSTW